VSDGLSEGDLGRERRGRKRAGADKPTRVTSTRRVKRATPRLASRPSSLTPPSAEQRALNRLDEVMMLANAAIARE
jgi:hypothetical protein